MPLMRCQSNGTPGWKWGESGKCYIGPDAQKKALAQGRAIHTSQFRKDIQVPFFFSNNPESKKELIRQRREMMKSLGKRLPPRHKKPIRMQTGKMIEMSYYSTILRLITPIQEITKEVLLPRLPNIIETYRRETRLDTYGELITETFGDVEVAFTREFQKPDIEPATEIFAKRTSDFNRKQVDRQFYSVLGVNPIRSEPYLASQVNAFVERNVALIKTIPVDYFKQIETIIRVRVEEGVSTTAIANEISEKFSSTKKRARLIARDQIGKFNGKLTELRQREVGVTHYIWITAADERVRPNHRDADGKKVAWKSKGLPVGSKGEHLHPGFDYQCIPGSTNIIIPDIVHKVFRRWYDGELTEIITNAGEILSATPNHPVLTNKGWKAINKLDVGDDLISTTFNSINGSKRDEYNRNVHVEQIFNFFSIMSSPTLIPGFPSQFHGDGIIDKNVNVISTDSCLLDDSKTSISEDFSKKFFSSSHVSFSNLSCNREFLHVFFSLGFPDNSNVRFISKLFSLFSGKFSHSEEVRLRAVSWLNSIFKKTNSGSISSNIVFLGDSKFTHSRGVISDNRFYIKLLSILWRSVMSGYHEAPTSEMLAKIISIDSKKTSNLEQTSSISHQRFRIVQKRRRVYSGHVYNLQTKCGWYTSNYYTTKNCRCYAQPVLDDFFTQSLSGENLLGFGVIARGVM